MDRLSKIVLLSVLGLLLSCSNRHLDKTSKAVLKKYRKQTSGALYVAKWKGKYKNYYFIGMRDDRFVYSISWNAKLPKQLSRFYAGEYKIRQDTLFLTYFENHSPPDLSMYMVKDRSGRFLYQKLHDTTQIRLTIRYRDDK